MEGTLYVLRTDCHWKFVPKECGCTSSIHHYIPTEMPIAVNLKSALAGSRSTPSKDRAGTTPAACFHS